MGERRGHYEVGEQRNAGGGEVRERAVERRTVEAETAVADRLREEEELAGAEARGVQRSRGGDGFGDGEGETLAQTHLQQLERVAGAHGDGNGEVLDVEGADVVVELLDDQRHRHRHRVALHGNVQRVEGRVVVRALRGRDREAVPCCTQCSEYSCKSRRRGRP